jgi:hypothetical protein
VTSCWLSIISLALPCGALTMYSARSRAHELQKNKNYINLQLERKLNPCTAHVAVTANYTHMHTHTCTHTFAGFKLDRGTTEWAEYFLFAHSCSRVLISYHPLCLLSLFAWYTFTLHTHALYLSCSPIHLHTLVCACLSFLINSLSLSLLLLR